jgi:hypothetical protein
LPHTRIFNAGEQFRLSAFNAGGIQVWAGRLTKAPYAPGQFG